MNMRISTSQTQKQVLAPVLQQSISVLMLSLSELNLSIEHELQNNPMLELDTPAESLPNPTYKNLSISFTDRTESSNQTQEDNEQPLTPIVQAKSLEDLLLTQLRVAITDPLQKKIGELIIGNLDTDGYLSTSLEEIAWLAKTDNTDLVEKVLYIVQQFDPIGIASRDIKECLINQIKSSQSVYRLQAEEILNTHFELFFQKKFDRIAKETAIPVERIREIAEYIATLEPKPARNFQSSEPTVYVQPDVYLFKDNEGNFHIDINKYDTPSVRINPLYMKLLNDPKTSAEDRKFIQEKLTNAVNFIKSIQQRGETLNKICQLIVERQKSYFEEETSSLLPLALKDIAHTLKRNESTISRAIHNKYMQTSMGIFPLRFFFSNAVNNKNKNISSQSIREEIKKLIQTEDKENPLSDQEILNYFQAQGLKMARRTINKYRQELDIPPSHQRKT